MNSQPPVSSEQTTLPPQQTRVPVKFQISNAKPWVTYVILGLTVVIYGLQSLSTYLTGGTDWPYILGGKINQFILAGQMWRLVTPILLHGSILHIAFNMYALFILGPGLEKYYGHWRYLLLYVLGGYCGNALSFLLSQNPSIGASTAIFGLVAAEAIFIYRNRMLFGTRARSMLINLGMVVAVNLILGLQPGIDNWGHLGGLVGGLIFAWVAGPRYQMQQTINGLELKDAHSKQEAWWGFLLAGGLFTAIVIGKMIAGG